MNLTNIIQNNNITSLAIGGFDGMHLAHQKLFSYLDINNSVIVVIETGYASLSPNKNREDYTSLPIYYFPLENIKHLDGQEFINLLLKHYPNLNKIVVGYDFHFGANRKYNTNDLKTFFHGEVTIVNEVSLDNIPVHSQVIRKYLTNDNLQLANKLLNKPYKIKGTHISGQGLGAKQFVATININCTDFLIPSDGIYATTTTVNNKEYKSVSFLGHRVTTDGIYAIETHILDENITKINTIVEIKFYKKLRDNKKFDTFKDLQKAILNDIKLAKEVLEVL